MAKRFRTTSGSGLGSLAGLGCTVQSLFLAPYVWLGYISTKFLCVTFLKFGGFFVTLLVGIVFGTVTVPVGLVVWLLQCAGVHLHNFAQ